jgi:hypothetical protein
MSQNVNIIKSVIKYSLGQLVFNKSEAIMLK